MAEKHLNPPPSELLKDPVMLLAFGFGSGLSPKMPGTIGTLAAIPFFLLFAGLPLIGYLFIIVVACAAGVYICDYAATKMRVHDHAGIVWDEFVGYWITMLLIPVNWKTVLLGFVLFRLFDIIKPWPINVVDRKTMGGFGIMLDDAMAGVAAWLCMMALVYGGLL